MTDTSIHFLADSSASVELLPDASLFIKVGTSQIHLDSGQAGDLLAFLYDNRDAIWQASGYAWVMPGSEPRKSTRYRVTLFWTSDNLEVQKPADFDLLAESDEKAGLLAMQLACMDFADRVVVQSDAQQTTFYAVHERSDTPFSYDDRSVHARDEKILDWKDCSGYAMPEDDGPIIM